MADLMERKVIDISGAQRMFWISEKTHKSLSSVFYLIR
jgi:hypothetical protein